MMNFKISSKAFLSALNATGCVVPAKAALQILTNFLIEVKESHEIAITASDTENRATVAAQVYGVDGTGAFCIDARFLLNVIRNLPECEVNITVDDNAEVTISTEKNTFKTMSQSADQYPQQVDDSEAIAEMQMPTEAMLTGFMETAFAVGKDDFRPQMTGVYFDVKPDKVVFVATDTRQMVKSVHTADPQVEAHCIIPPKAVSAFSTMAAKSANITVRVYPKAVEFVGESFRLRSQLIEGNYPPYDRVIPQNNNIQATFNRAELVSAVRRCSACADAQYGLLRFAFDFGQVVISATDVAYNRSSKETLECECSTQLTVGLSYSLLMGLLSAISAEKITMLMASNDRPVLIVPVGDDHLTMLLMPMHIDQ